MTDDMSLPEQLTVNKVNSLVDSGWKPSGVILEKDGKRMLVELGACRFLTQEEMWALMHSSK